MSNKRERDSLEDIEVVREVYAAINRNDIRGAMKDFAPEFVRVEAEGFPMSGTYRGLDEVEAHFLRGRDTWAEGSCVPEDFIVFGDKIVVYVHVRVRLKENKEWIEGRIADVFVMQNGQIIEMRTFVERQAALDWVEKN